MRIFSIIPYLRFLISAGYETFRTCKKGNSYSLANDLFQIVKDKTARKAGEEDGSQWHGRQVLDYLDSRIQRKQKKPFLIYFGFSHPHDERWGRDDLNQKYGVRNVKEPPTEVSDQAPRFQFPGCPSIRFPTATQTYATKSGSWSNDFSH